MNTKKLLISGAIATGMLVGVAMPSVFAANKITFQKDYLKDGESVTIMQNADGKSVKSIDLTAATVKEAVEKKFTGTTVKSELKTVGTGTVVELADGVKITVVYKGDANGDGKISVADAGLMVRASFGTKKLTAVQEKAADIGGTVDKVNSADAGIVVRLLFGGKNATTAYSKMEEFMPEDVVVVDNKVVAEKAEAVKEVAAVKAVCEDITVTTTENGAKAEVKIKADQASKKVSEVKSELLGTAMQLAADNQELVEAAKSVKLSYDNGSGNPMTVEISKDQIADILTNSESISDFFTKMLLANKTLASLIGDKLTVTVELDAAKALLNNAKEGATQVYEIDFANLAK